MEKDKSARELRPDPPEPAAIGAQTLGIYNPVFRHKKESLAFFKACVSEDVFTRAMNSEVGHAHPYVAARAFLNQSDWEKFVWIEEHGSLDGFPKV